jgi:hypothetical protein
VFRAFVAAPVRGFNMTKRSHVTLEAFNIHPRILVDLKAKILCNGNRTYAKKLLEPEHEVENGATDLDLDVDHGLDVAVAAPHYRAQPRCSQCARALIGSVFPAKSCRMGSGGAWPVTPGALIGFSPDACVY